MQGGTNDIFAYKKGKQPPSISDMLFPSVMKNTPLKVTRGSGRAQKLSTHAKRLASRTASSANLSEVVKYVLVLH